MSPVRHLKLCVWYVVVYMLTLSVWALPTDKKEKVYIVANRCIYNYKNGDSQFNGEVKIDQGSTHITADKLTTRSNIKHEIEEAIAYGIDSLAHYWTLPKLGAAEIHAQAKVIKYYPISSNISLLDRVHVTQKRNHFQGQVIHYNMHNETITVPASENGRATLIYDPDK